MEIIKENKKMIIFLVVILILIIGILVLSLFEKSDSSNLMVNCSRTVHSKTSEITQSIEIYDYISYKTMILKIVVGIDQDVNQNMLENYLAIIEFQTKQKIQSAAGGEIPKDVVVSSKIEGNKAIISIENKLTEENAVEMYQLYDTNFYEMTKEEMKNYFIEDGLTCES